MNVAGAADALCFRLSANRLSVFGILIRLFVIVAMLSASAGESDTEVGLAAARRASNRADSYELSATRGEAESGELLSARDEGDAAVAVSIIAALAAALTMLRLKILSSEPSKCESE